MTSTALRVIRTGLIWPRCADELTDARAVIDAGEAQGLYIGEHPDGAYIPKSLGDLKDFFEIKSIQFGKVPTLSSKGIEKFQSLESLWIEEFEPFDLEIFTNLRELSFTASKGFDVGFRLPKLTTLLLSKSAVQDCHFVEGFESLNDIVMLQANKLKSLNGLELASGLSRASIGYAPNLTDISTLPNCESLRCLELRNLKKVADYTPIFQISGLKRLIFSKCNAIASLGHITRLTQLEHLALIDTDVLDGDLAPTLNLTELSHVGIYPMKKHFSPSGKEVEKKLGSDSN